MDTSGFDRLAGQILRYSDILLRLPDEIKEQAFDIHMVRDQPLSVCGSEGVFFVKGSGTPTRVFTEDVIRTAREDLQEVFVQVCGHSVFSHEHEIAGGYIAMEGSCRAGVCGTAVLKNGRVESVRDITSLVFRIPREVRGCADRLFLEGAVSGGVLIVGEPSSGKTTLLRDAVYSLSTGKFQPSRRVAVLDQRGEIGGGFSLGPSADVLLGYPKEAGFDIAIRMLSPEYIVCDELSPADLEIVERSVFSGVSLIASVHGERKDLQRRPLCRRLLATGAFRTLVFLAGRAQPGEIDEIEIIGDDAIEAFGCGLDLAERPVPGDKKGGRTSPA